MERNFNKRKMTIVFGIVFSLIILIGSSYAFFTYSKSQEAFVLTSDKISATFTEGTNIISFADAYPISDEFALANLPNLTYVDFTVSTEASEGLDAVAYEIFLTEEGNNLLSSDYVKVYLTDENNKGLIDSPKIYSDLKNSTYDSNGKVIFTDQNTGEISRNYRLYVWIDSNYSQNEVSQNFNFKVNIYAYNINQNLNTILKKEIIDNTNDTCTPVLEEDGIIYFSGTNDCVNFNYVWYSGKLWRITAINPDGTVKMITDDVITEISYGNFQELFYLNENEYSYAYEWLNYEFLPTLYNYQNIIEINYDWNMTTTELVSTKLGNDMLVKSNVALLNTYEYYKSYENVNDYLNGYLVLGKSKWYLLNLSTTKKSNWYVREDGYPYYSSNYPTGIRPTIVLKSSVMAKSGDGTKDNPYILKDTVRELTYNQASLNQRAIGEYVNFNNELYRIVDVENNATKLVKVDFVKDQNGKLLVKDFASVNYGTGTSDDYWDYYLNNTWYNSIPNNYKEMIVKGNFYFKGIDDESVYNYKSTICENPTLGISTKQCTKTSEYWNGYIGALRLTEMFVTEMPLYNGAMIGEWTITKYGANLLWYKEWDKAVNNGPIYFSRIEPGGTVFLENESIKVYVGLIRPSFYLSSSVKVTSGDGSFNNPYEISL